MSRRAVDSPKVKDAIEGERHEAGK